MEMYKFALIQQKKLRTEFKLPFNLINRLKNYPSFDTSKPLLILPIEWVTQIGHIALLDIFLKIEILERKRNYNYVLLAPTSMVANAHYLKYWEHRLCIVQEDALIRLLLPYQRQLGEGFIPFLHDDENIEPWTRVGARAQYNWQQSNRAPLLTLSEEDRIFGQNVLRKMKVPFDARFVVIHIREGSYHNETKKGSGEHRNADLSNYLDAIKEITNRGGWVIRMGDAKMTPLPKMEKVIDYALSSHKSNRMDVFLIASTHLFIGTTSGLTTAALSFDTPALLVNVISNDWQLWTNKTHFLPKKLYDSFSKKYLTLPELYLTNNKNLLIKQELINQKKWKITHNSSEDILEAVRYKLDVLDNKNKLTKLQEILMEAYQNEMIQEPYMFGAAHIVPAFLEKYPYLLSNAKAIERGYN